MTVESRQVKLYLTQDDKSPYVKWVSGFKDQTTKARIDVRATDLVQGKLGKCKALGQGVTELILNFGPGYRIYIGEIGNIIIILCGGDKSTQENDIKKAKEYWEDYKDRARRVRALRWTN